jgi:hypothetical protein
MDLESGNPIIRNTVSQAMLTISQDSDAPPGLTEHAEAVGVLLHDMITCVVSDNTWPGPLVLVSLCRTLNIDRAGLDVLAHHTLTALLAQQPGPEVLVRAGATFVAANCHLPAGNDHNPHWNSRRSMLPRHAIAAPVSHLPMPPTWACSGCAHEWPCATKQSQLLAEFGGTRPALGIYLGSCFTAALFDLPRVDKEDLRHRFLGWLPRESM